MDKKHLSKIVGFDVIKYDGNQFSWNEQTSSYVCNAGRALLHGEVGKLTFKGSIISVGEPIGLKWAFHALTDNESGDLTSIECAELIRDIKREHGIEKFEGLLTWEWGFNEISELVEDLDLLDHFDELPEAVKEAIENWEAESEECDNQYTAAANACERLKALGYSCDYDLSGALVDLHPL
jgi:hypothetical protein